MATLIRRILRKKQPLKQEQGGFTLVEMAVIAPIVILLIGAFIGLIISLTGEVMTSRGANVLTYDLQDALNRIENDVKLSTSYLAATNIDLSTTKQGFGGTITTGSTTAFTNVDKSATGGSYASLILNGLVTTESTMSPAARLVYLRDQPNACTTSNADYADFSKNRPMTYNIVYFVKDNTLWRRTIMPANYTNTSVYCGSFAPYQRPSCMPDYNATSLPFCKTSDEKLVEGIAPSNFSIRYFNRAGDTTPVTTAVNDTLSNEAREAALQATPTVEISLTAIKPIAGQDVSRTATVRATRLDTNATSIATAPAPTSVPSAPSPSGTVSDGHIVTFTWPRVDGATSYEAQYRLNNGAWQTLVTDISNTNRKYVVSAGGHTDKVDVQVRARNSFGASGFTSATTTIPLWAQLKLSGVGWSDYSPNANGYNSAGYTKTKAGLVMFKGLIQKSSPTIVDEVIANVPADYRPTGRLIFPSATGGGSGRVDVAADGVVRAYRSNAAWTSLEHIRYYTGSTPRTAASPLLNGWVNYGGSYAPASYAIDGIGRASIQGLVNSGTTTDNTQIFALPTSYTPSQSQYMHIPAEAGSYATIGVAAGSIRAKAAGSSSWLAVNAIYIPSSMSTTWADITLSNSWVNYANGNTTAQYTKTSDGVVYLKGLIRGGTTGSSVIVGNLPANFRPRARAIFVAPNATAYSRLDVDASGNLIYTGTSNSWLSLDGISFVAEK